MLKLMDAITDKKDWHLKISDEAIIQKWREETRASPDGLISDKAFAWCVRELRDRATSFERDMYIRTLDSYSRCAKSDDIIPTDLRDDLKRALRPLLEVDDDLKDWHPNSDSKVLNLVHPSLYPLVGDRSRILADRRIERDDCLEFFGQGSLVRSKEKKVPVARRKWLKEPSQDAFFSNRFQWLPADIQFASDGTEVKITSYINNLHPKQHDDLYSIIEKFIEKSVPLWNSILLRNSDPPSGLRIKIKKTKTEPTAEPSWFRELHTHKDDFTQTVHGAT